MDIIKALKEKNGLSFNDQQLNMVNHLYGPALFLSTAGSGKTTITCARIGQLIEKEKVKPEKILALSYSIASANDIKNRFDELFNGKIHMLERNKVKFSTIHSFALSVIGYYTYKTNSKIHIIEKGHSRITKKNILKKLYYDLTKKEASAREIEKILETISYAKNNGWTKKTHRKASKVMSFEYLYNEYENYKTKNNMIDYDDMIFMCYNLLKDNYELRNRYQNKYEFIQVDEAQDMSYYQYKIARMIAGAAGSLVLIADDDQCIYSYRGSNPGLLMNFIKEYPTVKQFYLDRNYRSTKTIVEISKEFIEKNKVRFDKEIKSNSYIEKDLNIKKFNSITEQNTFIVDEIKDNYMDELKETAVLFRDNLSVIRLVHQMIRKRIPFYIKDGNLNFFRHWIKNDIIAVLLLADDKWTVESLMQIFSKFKLFITRQQVTDVYNKQLTRESIFETFNKITGTTTEQRRAMEEFEKHLDKLKYMEPSEAVNYILEEMKYKDYLGRLSSYSGYGGYEKSTYARYIELLKYFTQGEKTITGFWNRIGKLQKNIIESTSNKDKNAITLSTFHSSKGLEFKNVFLIELNEGVIPSVMSIGESKKYTGEELDEERRLMYVALTRAKENLYLLSADTTSRFVEEIEKISIKRKGKEIIDEIS